MRVWRGYEDFVKELTARFPHEREGIRAFYDECWRVFNRCTRTAAGARLFGWPRTLLLSVVHRRRRHPAIQALSLGMTLEGPNWL